jgi:hypothetical protein
LTRTELRILPLHAERRSDCQAYMKYVGSRVTLLGADLSRAGLQTKRPRRSGAFVHHETKISDLPEHLPWHRGLHAPVTFDRAAHRD